MDEQRTFADTRLGKLVGWTEEKAAASGDLRERGLSETLTDLVSTMPPRVLAAREAFNQGVNRGLRAGDAELEALIEAYIAARLAE